MTEIIKGLEPTGGQAPKTAVVAGAADAHVLEAVFAAAELGVINPLLVGAEADVLAVVNELGCQDRDFDLVDIAADVNPSAVAVELVRAGRGDFIIKGKLETRDLLKPILNKETGLNKNGFITHFGFMQLAGYERPLVMSDAAIIPYPTLDDKVKIIVACREAMGKLGYQQPVVGALCAAETVNKKMPETVEAAKLADMAQAGEFGKTIVLGPISFDLATRKESAEIKGYASPYAGEADMLLVPNLVTGNVMSKIWNADPRNIMAGCIIGADIPIVLTSRSASAREKLNSILLSSKIS